MRRVIPYWEKGAEWAQTPFFIEKFETKLPVEATEIPLTTLPRYTFLFILEGEILAEIGGESCLCRGGQFLLIPAEMPFSVHHYTDLSGYTGSFSLSSLRDASYACITDGKPVFRTFWFDGAEAVTQLLDRMTAALARGDEGFISRAFDLLLYTIDTPTGSKAHPIVSKFFEMLFDRSQVLDSVSGYAERLSISPSYLNKLSVRRRATAPWTGWRFPGSTGPNAFSRTATCPSATSPSPSAWTTLPISRGSSARARA